MDRGMWFHRMMLHVGYPYPVLTLLIDKSPLPYGQEVDVWMIQEVVFNACSDILNKTLYKLFLEVSQRP